ncbi:hypothetical protein ACQP00_20345 [Dactylosporangium sp. CS-047395]|uniref:hypothetical protein n=1 Tax=Dactylosporangium sp. CS-047395 TaxID=3239936 RepID=UPI003D8FED80
MERVEIDALTWRLRGVDESRLYAGAHLEALVAVLTCPACGEAVTVDLVPVDGTTAFLVGHWRCTVHASHTSATP